MHPLRIRRIGVAFVFIGVVWSVLLGIESLPPRVLIGAAVASVGVLMVALPLDSEDLEVT